MKDHKTLTAKPFMALCRCGDSTYLPYCDGNHEKTGTKMNRDLTSYSEEKTGKTALCHCGNSSYLPYCDGNH